MTKRCSVECPLETRPCLCYPKPEAAAGEFSLPEIIWAEPHSDCNGIHYNVASVGAFQDAALRELRRVTGNYAALERMFYRMEARCDKECDENDALKAELLLRKDENEYLQRKLAANQEWDAKLGAERDALRAELATLRNRESPEEAWKRSYRRAYVEKIGYSLHDDDIPPYISPKGKL